MAEEEAGAGRQKHAIRGDEEPLQPPGARIELSVVLRRRTPNGPRPCWRFAWLSVAAVVISVCSISQVSPQQAISI